MMWRASGGAVTVAAIASLLCACSAPRKYQAGLRSLDELVDDLSTSTSEPIRSAAAARLGELQNESAEFGLLLALRDPAASVREAAVKALVQLTDPSAVEPLCGVVMKDIDRRTRIAAAWALARFQDPRAIKALASALPDIGEQAASALGALGPAGVAPLVEAVKNSETREIAGTALVSVGEPAVGPLIEILQGDSSKYVRAAAAHVLAQIGGEQADGALSQALKQTDPEVIAAAYRFLIRSGQPGTESVLIKALNSEGGLEMASDFAYSGNDALKSAASEWAARKHYVIPATPDDDEERVHWGKPLAVVSQLAVFHYDNSLSSASGAVPARAVKTSFVPGRAGSALAIAPGGILTYPAANNLDFRNGTIQMWIAPQYEGSDPVYSKRNHALLIHNLPSGDHFVVAENNERSFYAGTVVGRQFTGAGGGDISAWKAGNWHHLAFSYSASHSRQRLYIDGMLITEHTGSMAALGTGGGTFAVDSDFWGQSSAFLVDDLRILNQEQSPTAVLQSVIQESHSGNEIAPHQ